MIQSRTILPYSFTYLPFSYYANNLSICEDVYRFKSLIELNNLFYSILNSSTPGERARNFIINLNELAPELSPDIIIKYTNLYNRLPGPIRQAGLQRDIGFEGFGGGAGGGGGGGGSSVVECSGSDQISLLARKDLDDSRLWATIVESEIMREYLRSTLVDGPRGSIKKLLNESNTSENNIEVNNILRAEQELGEMPKIVGWVSELVWNKLPLQSKRNILILIVGTESMANGTLTEEQMQAERECEAAYGGETLAATTHNVPGVEKSRRIAAALEKIKEEIKNDSLSGCSDIDDFHFKFNAYSLAQRLYDNPIELYTDSNPDTHDKNTKSLMSRTGKRVPEYPSKNYDDHSVVAPSRSQESSFSSVDRPDGESSTGPIDGDVGTKANININGGVTDPPTR